jgi:hypothetical protein
MTDEPMAPDAPADAVAPVAAADDDSQGAPTPEELLAETRDDDPEVGSDGTGMGELP